MKKNYLLSIFLFLATSSFAQSYLPMAIENAHWIVYSLGEILPNHHFYTVKGDTAINGIAYKKLWRRPILNFATSAQQFQPPFLYGDSIALIGALRDDTPARRAYCIPFFWPIHENDTCDIFTEWLIHDYDVAVGDTIESCLHSSQFFPVVAQSIDIENLWGANRRVIENDGFVRLVEGVGTDMGPFWAVYVAPHPGSPIFLYDYCVGEEGECGLDFVSITRQPLADWRIKLSPNPVADVLTIELPEGRQEDLQLSILDYSGKTVLQQQFNYNIKSMKLNIGHLANGVYLLTIGNEKGMAARRFAKQ
ncbi:MAG: T9SS type A sorting domain-containing protein [Saprospiraceae bacterium]|nr:T9SS type A sorting domain-containing protein [Saprospiraceae bacterium]